VTGLDRSNELCLCVSLTLHKLSIIDFLDAFDMATQLSILQVYGKAALVKRRKEHNWWG
jgi:hypothetical protein